MKILKKLFYHSLAHYIVPFCIGAAITIIYLWVNGTEALIYFGDGLSIGGAVVVILGGLMTTAYFGSFDYFKYSFGRVFQYKKNKNVSFNEYIDLQTTKRSAEGLYFVPYYLIGILYIVVALIVYALI